MYLSIYQSIGTGFLMKFGGLVIDAAGTGTTVRYGHEAKIFDISMK
jgi:hypothetical protein